ncbi:hypothetical protein H8959_015096 [Pygathrix nigripes]
MPQRRPCPTPNASRSGRLAGCAHKKVGWVLGSLGGNSSLATQESTKCGSRGPRKALLLEMASLNCEHAEDPVSSDGESSTYNGRLPWAYQSSSPGAGMETGVELVIRSGGGDGASLGKGKGN